jgi:hypothetical protein
MTPSPAATSASIEDNRGVSHRTRAAREQFPILSQMMVGRSGSRRRRAAKFSSFVRMTAPDPEKPDVNTIEIDAIAVLDSSLYLCEAKSSGGLSGREEAKLISAARRVRPNILLLITMDEDPRKMTADGTALQSKLGNDVRVEVMGFSPGTLRRDPVLP